jgi:hypothetical protein
MEKIIGECECCGFEEVEVGTYTVWDDPLDDKTAHEAKYCDLCAGTITSTFSRCHRAENDTLQTICYVGNAIIQEIRKTKK